MLIGLGDVASPSSLHVCVYIANRPPMPQYRELDHLAAMQTGEITQIGQQTGNHWRKVFNVYAKLMFAFLHKAHDECPNAEVLQGHFQAFKPCDTWQAYRDKVLLQEQSHTALLFGSPDTTDDKALHIIMGKTHGEMLGYPHVVPHLLPHLNGDFALYNTHTLIGCPYFDYRQLSNAKIDSLVEIMLTLVRTDL